MALVQIPAPATATNFTWRMTMGSGNTFNGFAYNGSNLYVAYGTAGSLYTSPDGITWTSRTSGFGANAINKVFYGNSLWVAVGNNGTISTSSDGITWTTRTSNMSTNVIFDVNYDNSVWVAVGAGGGTTNTGGITYSSDGITWTRKSQSITVGTQYRSVVWNGTNWVVGAQHSTNNYLYASTPSGTWTAGADGSAATINSLYWDGTRHVVQAGGTLRFSTSTTLGTTTNYTSASPFDSLTNNYYYNGVFYSVGALIVQYVTTPRTGNYAQRNYSILSPGALSNTAEVIASQSQGVFVGSAGYIIGTSYGEIYTSF